MKFKAHISDEVKEILDKEYSDYVRKTPMTPDERKAVRKRVSLGNSVYDNECMVYGENGWPIEYLEEYRMEKEIEEATRYMSKEDAQRYVMNYFGFDCDECPARTDGNGRQGDQLTPELFDSDQSESKWKHTKACIDH